MNSEGSAAPIARTYPADDPASFKKFVDANNSSERKRNMYFLPNGAFLTGKRRKANVAKAQFLVAMRYHSNSATNPIRNAGDTTSHANFIQSDSDW